MKVSNGFKFFLALISIALLSIFLTPVVHALLPFLRFEKIHNRLVMIFAIAAAAIFVRVRKESWAAYGFDFRGPWKRLLAWGFLGGLFVLACVTIPEVIWGPRYVRDPILLRDVVQRFAKGFLSGAAVGIVEEFFFRGFIYSQLAKRMNAVLAVLLTSAFYSLTHFFNNGQIFIPENPGLIDAVRLFLGYLEPFAFHSAQVVPEFFGLFLFGIVLNIAFLKTKTLFLPIGIHAGVVFLIKFQNSFLRKGPGDYYHPWFGNQPHYDGPFEWAVLLAFAFLIYRMMSPGGAPRSGLTARQIVR